MPYQKLLTAANRKALPKLYSTEHTKDPIVHVKFFTPWTNWTWYATEFDGEDRFFGLVVGHEKELGYFSLKELESVRGRWGLKIERDMYFGSKPLSEVKILHGMAVKVEPIRHTKVVQRKTARRKPVARKKSSTPVLGGIR